MFVLCLYVAPIALSIAGDTEQALWFRNAPPEIEGEMEDQQVVAESAEDCKNMHQLKAWYTARKAVLDKYVPKPYENFSLDMLRQEYKTNAHRLQKGQAVMEKPNEPTRSEAQKHTKYLSESTTTAPIAGPLLHEGEDCWESCGEASGFCSWCGRGNACCRKHFDGPPECSRAIQSLSSDFHSCTSVSQAQGLWSRAPLLLIGTQAVPAAAEDCTNKSQLDAWYAAQKANMQKYVPGNYANFPLNALKKDYEQNLQRLKEQATKAESSDELPRPPVDDTPAVLLHSREDCWKPCGGAGGFCSWCGEGNACCRRGFADPSECSRAKLSLSSSLFHACVAMPSQSLALAAEPESIGSPFVVSLGVGSALLIGLSAFLACRMPAPPAAPSDYVQLPPSEA